MKPSKLLRLFIILVLLCITSPCFTQTSTEQTGSITIAIEPVYNGTPLLLTDQYYVNSNGDTLYIDVFKCYITNLTLTSGSINTVDSNSHLLDAERLRSYTFNIDHVPADRYTSLYFTAGVDSIANTNGANSGDLDPSKGMYWAWNTGYVMAKLEGRSNVCKTLHHAFEFHVGGYMPPYNAARTVTLPLPQAIEVKNGKHVLIHIKADAAAWFRGINLAKTNSIVIPGKEACGMADNYAQMFSITEIKSE